MLKRSKEIARAAAESAGIIAPRVADAGTAAELHRQSLVSAQAAVEAAELALQAAHDRGAELPEVTRLEAVEAAAKVERDRAEARYLGAEKRLKAAQAAEADKTKAAARVKLAEALARITKAGAEIDRLAAELAAQAVIVDAQYSALNEAQRDGVAAVYTRTSGGTMAELALERALAAQAGAWTGDKPAAVELAERVAGAVTAGAT